MIAGYENGLTPSGRVPQLQAGSIGLGLNIDTLPPLHDLDKASPLMLPPALGELPYFLPLPPRRVGAASPTRNRTLTKQLPTQLSPPLSPAYTRCASSSWSSSSASSSTSRSSSSEEDLFTPPDEKDNFDFSSSTSTAYSSPSIFDLDQLPILPSPVLTPPSTPPHLNLNNIKPSSKFATSAVGPNLLRVAQFAITPVKFEQDDDTILHIENSTIEEEDLDHDEEEEERGRNENRRVLWCSQLDLEAKRLVRQHRHHRRARSEIEWSQIGLDNLLGEVGL